MLWILTKAAFNDDFQTDLVVYMTVYPPCWISDYRQHKLMSRPSAVAYI